MKYSINSKVFESHLYEKWTRIGDGKDRNRSETRLKENSRFSPFTLGTAKLPRRSSSLL